VFLFKPRSACASFPAGPPSPLLDLLAGDFAARIARVWPSPHAVYLTAPSARRHLVCLALVQAQPERLDLNKILNCSMRSAIARAVPTAPPGLARALERLGERAWSEADYRLLLQLMTQSRSAKILRHRNQITVEDVRALGRLPGALLDEGLGGLGLGGDAADLLAEAFESISRRDGAGAQAVLARRWAGAGAVPRLVELVQNDLEPELPPPPFAGTQRLVPLSTKVALVDAAQRYKNCLRNQVRWAAWGVSAFYEWMDAPGAVLEISRDRLHGWSLDQARLTGNKAVLDPMRSEIIAELQVMGVRVGRTLWQIDDALDDLAAGPARPIKSERDAIAELFGEFA
jgi:hypothetical protein